MSAPLELLQHVPLFQGLDRGHLETVARSFKDRTFPAGSSVTTEGQGGVGFFVIEDGTATVSVGGEERRKLGAGDFFGEMALIDDSPRSATIVADTDLKCWGLTSWEFRPLVEQNASIAWSMLQTMAKRMREG
ncbi:MAG: cyclic nucleotide-binding domain-containing protein [Gaiellaceae bacterium]